MPQKQEIADAGSKLRLDKKTTKAWNEKLFTNYMTLFYPIFNPLPLNHVLQGSCKSSFVYVTRHMKKCSQPNFDYLDLPQNLFNQNIENVNSFINTVITSLSHTNIGYLSSPLLCFLLLLPLKVSMVFEGPPGR